MESIILSKPKAGVATLWKYWPEFYLLIPIMTNYTPNRASTDLYSLPKKTNMSCEALVTNFLTLSISAPCCLLLSYLITLETTDSLSSYLTYSLTPACRSVYMFAGTYSCYDRYDVGNTCGSFFMAQNITSLPYSDQQASICEEYANLSTILAK